MNTNEPTTGEIVRALRGCADKEIMCDECRYNMGNSFECLNKMQYEAADRLESQERELLQKTQELESAKTRPARKEAESAELNEEAIARAENAERERDAAIAEFRVAEEDGLCCVCQFIGNDIGQTKCMEDCCFKWRGLPQEGEKQNG